MARKKIKKNIRSRKISSQKSLSSIFKKSEFWAGVVTVIVIIGLFSRLPYQTVLQTVSSYRIKIVRVTPAPITKKYSNPNTPIVAQPTKSPQKQSVRSYIIQENDSYFKATENVCGDGTFFLYNQEFNSNKPLQIGETILIRCDWE